MDNNLIEAFLNLSLEQGLLAIITTTVVPGLVVILVVRRLLQAHLAKQHERVGRLLFRVSASLLALLISLSYANEKINYNKVTNSLEEEASLIASAMLKLRMHQSQPAEMVREGLMDYVQYTIDDRWEHVIDNPYLTKMMGTIVRINIIVLGLPTTNNAQTILKPAIISDIDQITKTMQIRFYSSKFHLPYLTYILGFGLIIAWCFYSVYRPDVISLTFITLYNIFIAVLLYFVIMLGNPMVGPLKIRPEPFNILQDIGLDKLPF
jgi:hypothetical protein